MPILGIVIASLVGAALADGATDAGTVRAMGTGGRRRYLHGVRMTDGTLSDRDLEVRLLELSEAMEDVSFRDRRKAIAAVDDVAAAIVETVETMASDVDPAVRDLVEKAEVNVFAAKRRLQGGGNPDDAYDDLHTAKNLVDSAARRLANDYSTRRRGMPIPAPVLAGARGWSDESDRLDDYADDAVVIATNVGPVYVLVAEARDKTHAEPTPTWEFVSWMLMRPDSRTLEGAAEELRTGRVEREVAGRKDPGDLVAFFEEMGDRKKTDLTMRGMPYPTAARTLVEAAGGRFEETSWKNDAADSFQIWLPGEEPRAFTLWVDEWWKENRETSNRFAIVPHVPDEDEDGELVRDESGETLLETDDPAKLVQFLREIVAKGSP
jgi:hypothetical protein